jgi:hypothetical protein
MVGVRAVMTPCRRSIVRIVQVELSVAVTEPGMTRVLDDAPLSLGASSISGSSTEVISPACKPVAWLLSSKMRISGVNGTASKAPNGPWIQPQKTNNQTRNRLDPHLPPTKAVWRRRRYQSWHVRLRKRLSVDCCAATQSRFCGACALGRKARSMLERWTRPEPRSRCRRTPETCSASIANGHLDHRLRQPTR